MRILYGVQATGNGHISRARAMAKALSAYPDLEVTWLFSGRPKDRLFDMELFGDYECRRGLTFVTESGSVKYWKTLLSNNYWVFLKDAMSLSLAEYDLVVTDYEPVTAWAGIIKKRSVIGIGHQYAFGEHTPRNGGTFMQRTVMSCFAPAKRSVGLHWHPFDSATMPPILDLPDYKSYNDSKYILVYLPFEDQSIVTEWLNGFQDHEFVQYSADLTNDQQGNVTRRKASFERFKSDLAGSSGVICNSGFELISECLHWRKPALTRPLARQMEQLSNAAALEQLGYATTMGDLDSDIASRWLDNLPAAPKVCFPDVSRSLADWLAHGAEKPISHLSKELWMQE